MLKKIIALHGFLGQKKDFQALKLENLSAINIFNTELSPLDRWAKRFNKKISGRPILMGYSMGGRLALHCLVQDESRFSGAIIIAAHPGLNNHIDRLRRKISDYHWSQKFLSLSWEPLLNEWNQAPALKTSSPIVRCESDFSRLALSQTLTKFSLANQDNLSPKINQLKLPILWLCPESEQDKLQGIKLAHKSSQVVLVKNANHRLIFEHADFCARAINKFRDCL